MPKKAVATFLLAALAGAAIFVYFTFPRTADEIPKSNNQRPFPSAPGPNNMPEPAPKPNAPEVPHGPALRVLAWATPEEAKALSDQADAYQAATGRSASFTIDNNVATYRHDLQQALASDTPPDLCLVESRDFSGTDARKDFAPIMPDPGVAPRALAAFTSEGKVMAIPAEFSVEVLFYNPNLFDRAGLGYPDRHWNWDLLEAMSRAIGSLNLKDAVGNDVYPVELPTDFDFWNILCTQAGHPALDLNVWHLADTQSKDSQVRALNFIREIFHDLVVTAPLPKGNGEPGSFFAQGRAALLIARSDFVARLPKMPYAMTLLPSDISRASLARVNGWAVPVASSQPAAAADFAKFLAHHPVHAGWTGMQKPPATDEKGTLCYEALDQSLVPQLGLATAPIAQYLDDEIGRLARDGQLKTDIVYAQIQSQYKTAFMPLPIDNGMPQPLGKGLKTSVGTPVLRGL